MTSSLRGSQITLYPDTLNGRTPRHSTQTNNRSTFNFDEDGHPEFEGLDQVGEGARAPRPFSLDTIGNNYSNSKGYRKSGLENHDDTSHQGSSENSLRSSQLGKEVDVDDPPRVPEPTHQKKRSRPPSSLWIRDSEGRPIVEIGLNEGRYLASPTQGVNEEEAESKEEEAAEKSGDEEKGTGGPPKPVGFWDSSLKTVRLEIFKRWAFMSEFCTYSKDCSLTIPSFTSISIYPCNIVVILGGSIQNQRQPQLYNSLCGQF